ncbi:MAG TPA: outer membrane lipoprotein carrier protein LolA [Terriglobia bacterium]|nr:outer membrane lipoprotein carrier protein LolA [Terriglobia bacterium]
MRNCLANTLAIDAMVRLIRICRNDPERVALHKPQPSQARTAIVQGPVKSTGKGTRLALAASALFAFAAWKGSALATAATSTPTLDNYIRQFEASYHDVRTLRATFTQEYSAWDRNRMESGDVYLARGGKMRWEYQKPEQKLFLSDGKDVLLYVPEQKQLTRTPIKESGDVRVPFDILVSHLNLRRAFSKIEFADSVQPVQPGDRVLRAYPKHGYEEVYHDVVVELTPTFDIRRLAVSYPDGTSMTFTFDQISRNVTVQPSMFELTPPEGTEVIQQ